MYAKFCDFDYMASEAVDRLVLYRDIIAMGHRTLTSYNEIYLSEMRSSNDYIR